MTRTLEGPAAATVPQASGYRAPVTDIMAALELAGLRELLALDDFSHLDAALVEHVLAEFGRFAAEVLLPVDAAGDKEGSRLAPATGEVGTPPGFGAAYRRYVEAGWGALQFPERFGGGGFPSVIGLALQEIFASANMALSLNPVLTQGAIELLLNWGSEGQQTTYLPAMLTGRWSGTMELTEPDAGSDLSEVKAAARCRPDGTWALSGTKIFITWGEHDLAENIVHLVLARAPGAPAGTKGLSLFLVPKFLPGTAPSSPGRRNSLRCLRLEEKLGIHASPTCVMEYDDADAELVGPLHGGLRAMFTMMNQARLSIGVEGPAISERSYQQARAYASERLQGRRPGTGGRDRAAIAEHPDVARMLLKMRASTLASRLLLYFTSASGDFARHGRNTAQRQRGQAYLDLLTPVAKAWSTDLGFFMSSTGIQVYGGAGYLEETGMAQRLRDIRIAPIYEGTNGIQAIDLVVRKVSRHGGASVRALLEEISATIEATQAKELAPTAELLTEARHALSTATAWVLERAEECPDDVLAGAAAYLELVAVTTGGWLMARRACAVGRADGRFGVAAGESNFFAIDAVAHAGALLRQVKAGAQHLSFLQ
ncbi:MAG TPA: acyl-CoA dehydrogenase [Acidimicrobiales bacterium]|nr:acyl-CoA dehydrogenase [Acidimicrobiales bacterium]